jgi:hypothetical protein
MSQKKLRRRIQEVLDVLSAQTLGIFGLTVGISSRLKGRPTTLLSMMSQKKKKKKTLGKDQKFLAFVAPHEDQEDSQSYYSERSDEDGEELKEAYKVLNIKFLKLIEIHQQHVHELLSLQTEKSSLLLKIQDLEEKLLETQL